MNQPSAFCQSSILHFGILSILFILSRFSIEPPIEVLYSINRIYRIKPVWSRLFYPTETKIRRYVKVRAEANPLDPQWHNYFEDHAFFKKFCIHRREAGLSKSG